MGASGGRPGSLNPGGWGGAAQCQMKMGSCVPNQKAREHSGSHPQDNGRPWETGLEVPSGLRETRGHPAVIQGQARGLGGSGAVETGDGQGVAQGRHECERGVCVNGPPGAPAASESCEID